MSSSHTYHGYRSEREEPFYMVTAEVKNKQSLTESLELFIEPELLAGDNKIEVEEDLRITGSSNDRVNVAAHKTVKRKEEALRR